MTDFTLNTTVQAPYAETLTRVRELLGDAGFGVLTEIDLGATLHTKLGVEIPTSFSPSEDIAEVVDEARRRLTGMMTAVTGEVEGADAARA